MNILYINYLAIATTISVVLAIRDLTTTGFGFRAITDIIAVAIY